jgi:hypothetical protein
MDTSAQSQASRVPRTPPPSPEPGHPTHQPSRSPEPLDLRGLEGIESNREAEPRGEITHDKSSNQKTFLGQKADGECAITEVEDYAMGQHIQHQVSLKSYAVPLSAGQSLSTTELKGLRQAILREHKENGKTADATSRHGRIGMVNAELEAEGPVD